VIKTLARRAFLMFLLTAGLLLAQKQEANLPPPEARKMIDQKDVQIHNLRQELEYVKSELQNLQNFNTRLLDSLRVKSDSLSGQKVPEENENLRVFHRTIEDDRKLANDIIADIQGNKPTPDQPPATAVRVEDDSEFRSKYNEALNQYFDGQFVQSQKNFQKLLLVRQDHPLSDNCQYWAGECFYSLEKYMDAIDAFRKVRQLGDGNKADAAQYKIGLSYLKLGRRPEALAAFRDLEKNFPRSELVGKAREYFTNQEKF